MVKPKTESIYFVIMGAAVQPNGVPSGAMQRRIRGALELAKSTHHPFFIVSGGVGKHEPSEATVMRNLLLKANIAGKQIIIEDNSTNTFLSIWNCTKIIKKAKTSSTVIVCSDRYHIARCRWLFHLFGIKTAHGVMPSGLKENGYLKWLYYYLREILAFPKDTFLALTMRISKKISCTY